MIPCEYCKELFEPALKTISVCASCLSDLICEQADDYNKGNEIRRSEDMHKEAVKAWRDRFNEKEQS